MEKLVINGKKRLIGEISISGAKNAAVAIIPAAILSDGICRIENLPDISDVNELINILGELGAGVRRIDNSTIEVDPTTITSYVVPAEKSKKLRASSYLMGAMLGRFSKASVAPPGGCDFGVRPIDQHIKGFELLGSTVTIENGMVDIRADKLVGNQIYLDVVSVGATVNIMLAAVKAKGLTIIENAAKEPHIVDLANFLLSMGADIRGAGTDTIKIRGTSHLHGTTYSIIPDQIEAGTYMAAVVAASGDVIIKNVIPKHLESITAKLVEMGATIDDLDDALRVRSNGKIRNCNIKTMPHPGFPTDMQPQIATVLSVSNGKSVITESIWDNRFKYAEELKKLGAYIEAEGKVAVVYGVEGLHGNTVKATDLRAGAAMVIAGLIADGQTVIEDIRHIQRGYEKIVDKLTSVGADIKIINE